MSRPTEPVKLARLWDHWRRAAFWDRDVDLATWQARVLEGHPSYLDPCLGRFPAGIFSTLLGEDRFVAAWPHLRRQTSKPRSSWAWYDLHWSALATGTYDVQPLPAWFDLTPDERRLLMAIAERGGQDLATYATSLSMEAELAQALLDRLRELGFVRGADRLVEGQVVHALFGF